MENLFHSVIRILIIFGAVSILVWLLIAQPTPRKNSLSQITLDAQRLRAHVEKLAIEFYPRRFDRVENLDKTAEYIKDHFARAGAQVAEQEYFVSGAGYRNVIGIFGKGKGRKLIAGAHYDTCGNTPGADDNASGVAGLIELAYLLGDNPIDREIELVAYTLEEPPIFRSKQMGSYLHASRAREEKVLEGVIVFEMIGYFSDKWLSQGYPLPLLMNAIYPNRANFIAVVGALGQSGFTRAVKAGMKGTSDLPVYSINAPKALPGIDFSDHRNYWSFDINAVMITDTAFYRYDAYHGLNDKPDRLDYARMAKVVAGVFEALRTI